MQAHVLETIGFRGSLPLCEGQPVVWQLQGIGLEFALADRDVLSRLENWQSSGVYVLIGDHGQVYAGKATSARGLQKRVREQLARYPWCRRALLVRNPIPGGFDSAEVAHLESELIARLKRIESLDCHNITQPFEHGLDEHSAQMLSLAVDCVLAMLAFVGVPMHGRPREREQSALAGIATDSVERLVREGILRQGETLYCAWPSPQPAATRVQAVVETNSLRCGESSYPSLSDAATLLAGRSVSGSGFWGRLQPDGSVISLAQAAC
jgi:hypothetical protein